MKGYIQVSWKFALSVFVAVCYLGILISYLKVQSKQEYATEDNPLPLTILPTTATALNPKAQTPSYKLTKSTMSNSKKIPTSKSLNKGVNTFTKTSSTNVSEENIVISAKIVIISAYMRTGSTLMGGMLHHHPGTFYLFEPIRHIYDAFTKAQNTTELMYVSGERRKFTPDDKREHVILQETHKWLSCNFQDLDIDTLVDSFHLSFKDSLYDFYKCAINHVVTIRKLRITENIMARNWTAALITRNIKAINECLSQAKQKCLEAPLRVIKFIRLRMPLVAELLPLYPNMQVVYLQRDPRGILRSRVKTGLLRGSTFSSVVVKHCNSSFNDIETVKTLTEQYPGRIKAVLYEDAADRPVETFESVFRFCGLNFSSDTKNYTISLTSLGGKSSCSFCIEKGNSSETAYQWRKEMSLTNVNFIDAQCSKVYKTLGYQRFFRLTDLRNFSIPSRTKMKLIL